MLTAWSARAPGAHAAHSPCTASTSSASWFRRGPEAGSSSLPARKRSAEYLSAPSALPPQDPCDSEKQPDRRPGVRRRPVSTSRLGGNCPPSRGRGSLRVTAPQKLPAFGEAGSEDTAGLPQTWEAIEASPSMIPVPHGPGAVPSGEQRPRAAASGAGGLRGRRLRVQRAQITWGLIAEDCPCNSTPGH